MSNTLLGKLPPLPGMVALGSEEEFPLAAASLLNTQANSPQAGSPACSSRDLLGQCQPPAGTTFPGEGVAHGVVQGAKDLSKIEAFLANGKRVLTLVLGLLLIAAALFSHPAVRGKIVAAGKVAALAA